MHIYSPLLWVSVTDQRHFPEGRQLSDVCTLSENNLPTDEGHFTGSESAIRSPLPRVLFFVTVLLLLRWLERNQMSDQEVIKWYLVHYSQRLVSAFPKVVTQGLQNREN